MINRVLAFIIASVLVVFFDLNNTKYGLSLFPKYKQLPYSLYFNESHPKNAYSPILVTLFGITIEVNELQLENA